VFGVALLCERATGDGVMMATAGFWVTVSLSVCPIIVWILSDGLSLL